MKQLLIGLFSLAVLTTASLAAVLHVSKSGIAPYTEVQPAINAASSGDTIVIAPSAASYQGFTVDQQLLIIGAGIDTTYGKASQVSGQVMIQDPADQSILDGIVIEFNNWSYNFGEGASAFVIQGNCSGIAILNCLIKNMATSDTYEPHWAFVALVQGAETTVLFKNSVLWGNHWSYYPNNQRGIQVESGANVTLENSILTGSYYTIHVSDPTSVITISHCLFRQNNYGVYGASVGSIVNSTSIDGTYGGSSLPLYYCQAATAVDFVEYSYDADPRKENFRLATTSPLTNAGNPLSPPDRDGSRCDIGIYGGLNPFDPKGIPDFPFVIELEAPASVPQNGILHIGSTGRVGSGN